MKKLLCLFLTLILSLSLLFSCAKPEEPEQTEEPEQSITGPYKIRRDGIIKITGRTILEDGLHEIELNGARKEEFLDQIDALCLMPVSNNYEFGYDFGFTVFYDDDSYIAISLIEPQIHLGGCDYVTELYRPEDFLKYFE
ncbi:MAG: hypothetical protein IJF38_06210 [Clostridia bacterium]|nr:hypothetical protein [Clostridia bacterium]